MTVDGRAVVVLGEPAAGITLASSAAGRLAVVVGIVRRSTSDSSAFQLLPRSTLDFRLGPAPEAFGTVAAARSSGSAGAGVGSGDPNAGAAANTVEIGSLAGRVGDTVTVAGLVTEIGGGTATIDDGTGRVRIGGSAAAVALEMLEPGDAIEVTGAVRRDDLGLIVEVDPASVVALPGDGTATPTASGQVAALLPEAATQSPGTSHVAAASIRQAVAAAPLPDAPTILAILLAMIAFSAAAVALSRSRGRIGRFGGWGLPLVAARVARVLSWRATFGRGDRS